MHRSAHDTPDAALAITASAQQGLFTHADATAAGLSPSAIANRVRRGMYVQVAEGLYSIAGHAPSRRRDLQAGLLLVGGEAALARDSAAEVHGLPRHPDPRVHVVVDQRSFHGGRQVVMHRSTWLAEDQVMLVDGLRTTVPARTLVDLAGSSSYFQLKKMVTHAVRHRLAAPAETRRMLGLAGRVRGAVNLRTVLDELSPLEASTATTLESVFLEVTTRHDVPPTAMNHPVIDANGVQRYLDAAYLPERVPVELDGELWHSLETDKRHDDGRERAILATGRWRPFLRFDWRDVTERPWYVVDEIRRALAAARQAT